MRNVANPANVPTADRASVQTSPVHGDENTRFAMTTWCRRPVDLSSRDRTRDYVVQGHVPALHRLRDVDHPFYGAVKVFDEADTISRTIIHHQEWEREIARLLAYETKANTDVLDIGANMGFSALGLLLHGGRPRRVHCFEPQPDVHAVLQYNTRNRSEIFTYSFGLSGSRFAIFSYDQVHNNIGGTQLHIGEERHRVATTSLDELDRRTFPVPISVVKIDVEAHEELLLMGAQHFFKNHRPVIVIEIMDHCVTAVTAALEALRYRRREHLGGWDYVFVPQEGS